MIPLRGDDKAGMAAKARARMDLEKCIAIGWTAMEVGERNSWKEEGSGKSLLESRRSYVSARERQ
jgi:hypothetical protein